MWTKTAVHLAAIDDRPEGWHYAQVWKTGGGPIGYCADHPPHPTERKARECYASYLRSQVRDEAYGDWTGCKVCDTPTKRGVTCGDSRGEPLCDEHRTPEVACEVLGLNGPAGDSFGS